MLPLPRFSFTSGLIQKTSQAGFIHHLRNALVLGLAALLFFVPLGSTVLAQQEGAAPGSDVPLSDYFITYQGENGEVVCRVANLAEQSQLRKINTENLGLHRIAFANRNYDSKGQFDEAVAANAEPTKIILRGTEQLENFPEAKAAFIRAALIWEQQIQSPIKIYIDVDYGTTSFGVHWGTYDNPLGITIGSNWLEDYQDVRASLIAGASTAEEASLYNSLPPTSLPTNTPISRWILVTDAVARALGIREAIAPETYQAPKIAFNANYKFDFNASDGIDADKWDFEAVAVHEIGHALGFTSTAGAGIDDSHGPSVWDFFRFRSGTTLETFGTAERVRTGDGLHYHFTGGQELGLSTGKSAEGDGRQASHWKDDSLGGTYIGIMDPTIPMGQRKEISSNDIVALNFLGYNIDTELKPPPPQPPLPIPANDNFANAETIADCTGSVNGTNKFATKEDGEPFAVGTSGTVWYQWQASVSGSVSMNTIGAGTNYDTILAVYTGNSVNSLTLLSRNDDSEGTSSALTFNATAGVTYKIAVNGFADRTGNFVLNWKQAACMSLKTDQSINFLPLANKSYGDAPFTVSASASSGLPISLSVLSGPATINGNTVTITGIGTVTIRASQAGDTTYNPAPDVNRSFTVSKAQAALTLGDLNQIYDGQFKEVTVTSNPTGLLNSVVLSYTENGSFVPPPRNAGTYTVTATLEHDYYQAADAVGTLVIAKAGQTISFAPLADKAYGTAPFNINATASSGLPVNFSVISGPATINGNTVSINGPGTVVIRASQAGDRNYHAATFVDRSFTVTEASKASQTITFASLPNRTYGDAPFVLGATASSGLPVSLSVLSGPVIINGNTVTITGAGSVTIRASQNGDANFNAAPNIDQSFTINKATPVITWNNPADIAYGTALNATQLNAVASVPGTLTYNPAVGTALGAGHNQTLSVSFTPADTANYNGATKSVSINVLKADQTITFGELSNRTFGDAPFSLSANASSGLPVSFQVVSGPVTLNGNTLSITGTGRVTVRAMQAGDGNYNAAPTVERAFDVTSASAIVTLSNPVYSYDGTPKSATATTNPAGLNVNICYSQNGTPVTSPINAGVYNVTATINDANYQGSATGVLVINQATPLITWNNPLNIIFGTALGNAQLNVTANVPGTFQYSPSAGTVLSVGTHQLSAAFTPTDAANYTNATKSVQLVVDSQPTPTLAFSSDSYSVNERDGNIAIVVNRTDMASAANVDYATSDTFLMTQTCQNINTGIASSRCDYATSVGTLRFAAGESSKTIYIPLVDDAINDGTESLTLTLSNPGGANLGSIKTATITIMDDDVTAGVNPIDQASFFVRQHYIDFLGREPDSAGLKGWQDILNNCGTTIAQPCDRIEVSSAFFRSEEFQTRGNFVYRFYPTAFGRIPRYAEFMPDIAKVSGFLSPAQLEANKVAFINEFMARTEFKNKYDSLTDPSAYVNALVNTAGVSLANKQQLIDALAAGTKTRAQVLREIAESSEVYTKYYTESFVVMQYFGYLRRDPDILYLEWIRIMNQNNGDYRGMISGFMNSAEYRQRFGQ